MMNPPFKGHEDVRNIIVTSGFAHVVVSVRHPITY